MTDKLTDTPHDASTWDDVRRVADELRLKLHLAGMEARDQWDKLQPRLAEIEQSIESGAVKASSVVSEQMSSLGATLRKLLAGIGGEADKDPPKPG